jgi:hypothetical protein
MLGAKAQVSCLGSRDRRGLTTLGPRGPLSLSPANCHPLCIDAKQLNLRSSSCAPHCEAPCRHTCGRLPTQLWAAQGYDELNTLERPLVSDVHEQEEYERQHGVGPAATYGSGGAYRPPTTGGGGAYYPPQPAGGAGYPPPGATGYPPAPPAAVGRVSQGPMPSQVRACLPSAHLPMYLPLLRMLPMYPSAP